MISNSSKKKKKKKKKKSNLMKRTCRRKLKWKSWGMGWRLTSEQVPKRKEKRRGPESKSNRFSKYVNYLFENTC